jgi:hypothetical protein
MAQPVSINPLSGRLADHLPTLFADGIINLSNSREVVKLILFRTDTIVGDNPKFENVGVGQVVLTMSGFVNAMALFEAARDKFIREGYVTEQQVADARALQGKVGT